MIALLLAVAVTLVVTLTGTPALIRVVHKLHYGQFIRQDGPQSHQIKRGTPTLGGVVIVFAIILGWLVSALYRFFANGEPISSTAIIVLLAMFGMGLLGFIDDFAKVRKKQNEGLSVAGKFTGQFIIATVLAIVTVLMPTHSRIPSAQAAVSFIEYPVIDFTKLGKIAALILFIIWVNFLMTAWTNAVNLTDGLDGLAAGSSMIAFLGYTFIAVWQGKHLFGSLSIGMQYRVADPQDLAIIAACAVAACFGFLWYNTNPAQIFMGDTGSLALGGLFAALSITTHTEILAVLIGGLFVLETCSDVIQVGYFKLTHKRVFKMAPIHHHFELLGWRENTVVVRFWMVEMMFVFIGLCVFYAHWVVESGLV